MHGEMIPILILLLATIYWRKPIIIIVNQFVDAVDSDSEYNTSDADRYAIQQQLNPSKCGMCLHNLCHKQDETMTFLAVDHFARLPWFIVHRFTP